MSTAPKTKIEEVETGTDSSELPEGWAWTFLSAITRNYDGRRIPVKQEDRAKRRGPYPYYGASGIIDQIDDYLFDGSFLLIGEDGANLLARSTPIAFIAKGQFWVNNHAHILQTCGDIPLEYLRSYINNIDLQQYVTGSAQPKLTQDAMNQISVPLPPLGEQLRVIGKLEQLSVLVDSARVRLSRVRLILKQFGQAVLAEACSGKLTEDWRREHPNVETADQLLKRIAVRRRKSVVQSDADTSSAYALPQSWLWVIFDDTCVDITVGHVGPMTHEYVGEGIPFLRSQNVREFRFETRGLKYISRSFHQKLSKSALHPSDVVVVRSGYPGVSCVIPSTLSEANCADLVIVRPSGALDPFYACIFINSSFAHRYVEAEKVGIAQGHFNVGSMRRTPLPLPPLEEQQEIVRRVEALFKLADAVERRVAAASLRADKLTQAILAKTFRGELVPTEAELARREGREYEPASVLLERIKRERAAAEAGKGKPSRKARSLTN